jgi:hypothetical protein
MNNPQNETFRRIVERLNDKERADLSDKLNEIFYKSQEQTDNRKLVDTHFESKWHKVENELPELGRRVIVVSLRPNGYRDMRIANLCEYRNEETGELDTIWTNPIMTEVITHWMPIPELPKENE